MDASARQCNTHTHSSAWKMLCDLFKEHVDEFTRVHAQERYEQKFHIGEAMWGWMLRQCYVTSEVLSEAEKVHFRPGKDKDGLPLWRLAFKASVRNTPEVDALFSGRRRGPTPRYARLADAGVLPVDPSQLQPAREPLDASQPHPYVTPKYQAAEEWIASEEGNEWLYIYSTSRELDNFRRHGIEPLLKIGSSRGHYSARIAQQAGSTAAGTTLVCVHAYRVTNARQAESAVHHALKLQGRHVKDVPGIEWFEVTSDAAHELVRSICGGLVRAAIARRRFEPHGKTGRR
jgi:hypothetical protein